MAVVKSRSTHDWVAIRRAYEQGDETIKQICARFGVSKGGFEHRYKTERWISRRASKVSRRGSTLERLFSRLEGQVTKLANAAGDTLGDKEAQQLTELIKNFDKINTMADEETVVPPQKRDMRDLREKLAKRIDQFNRR